MDWQIALTAIFVAVAAVHCGWRGIRALNAGTKGNSCGGCGGCPESKIAQVKPRLVNLELPQPPTQKAMGQRIGTP